MGSPRIKVRLKAKPFLEFLAKKNWSIQKFSKIAKVSLPMMTQMLAGLRFPGPIMRVKLQKHTHAAWDDIFEIHDGEGGAQK